MNFAFDKGKGINFRNKPICDECLLNLTIVFLDKYKEGIKRYLKQEIKLEHYSDIY
jgi:hypothetical protein